MPPRTARPTAIDAMRARGRGRGPAGRHDRLDRRRLAHRGRRDAPRPRATSSARRSSVGGLEQLAAQGDRQRALAQLDQQRLAGALDEVDDERGREHAAARRGRRPGRPPRARTRRAARPTRSSTWRSDVARSRSAASAGRSYSSRRDRTRRPIGFASSAFSVSCAAVQRSTSLSATGPQNGTSIISGRRRLSDSVTWQTDPARPARSGPRSTVSNVVERSKSARGGAVGLLPGVRQPARRAPVDEGLGLAAALLVRPERPVASARRRRRGRRRGWSPRTASRRRPRTTKIAASDQRTNGRKARRTHQGARRRVRMGAQGTRRGGGPGR